MEDGYEKLAKSRHYNEMHMKEHKKAMKNATKQMKKLGR